MKKRKIKVAIIDNSINPEIYSPVQHWGKYLNVEWETFSAKNGMFPDLSEGYTHLILTGSEASIIERDHWVYQEVEYVREAVGKNLPVFGSCYGHQLLAIALAGYKNVCRCKKPEIGWIPIKIRMNNPLLGPRGVFYAYTLHFDEVIDLDNKFEVLASTEQCRIHAFKLKNQPLWGLQAHPEINIPAGRQLFNNLISQETKMTPYFEAGLKSRSRDSNLIHRIIANFLKSGE